MSLPGIFVIAYRRKKNETILQASFFFSQRSIPLSYLHVDHNLCHQFFEGFCNPVGSFLNLLMVQLFH